jgi:hypothetical protein
MKFMTLLLLAGLAFLPAALAQEKAASVDPDGAGRSGA